MPGQFDLPPMPAPAEQEPSFLDKMMDNPAFKSAMRSAGTVIGRDHPQHLRHRPPSEPLAASRQIAAAAVVQAELTTLAAISAQR